MVGGFSLFFHYFLGCARFCGMSCTVILFFLVCNIPTWLDEVLPASGVFTCG
jgi:hypothetical protein